MSKHPLQDFITSRVRSKMIAEFFENEKELYYVRELTRKIQEEINAVRRELANLDAVGILKSENRGNRVYYYLNPSYVFYQELRQMVAKSSGLGLKLRKFRRKLGSVEFIMFSGRFIQKLPPSQNQLDVLVVGDIVLAELDDLIKKEEVILGREINYTAFSSEEFAFRKARRDPFVMELLYATRVMIIGDEVSFVTRDTLSLS